MSNIQTIRGEEVECPPGSPPWMSTFADLATLLMAFFVLLVSQTRVADPDEWKALGSVLKQSMGFITSQGGEQMPQGDKVTAMNFKNQKTQRSFEVKERTTKEAPQEVTLAVSEYAGEFDTYADLEILKETFAKEIAAGKIELKGDTGKLVVTVIGDDDADNDANSKEDLAEGEIDSDSLELYAKVADLQAEIATEVVVEHVDLQLTDFARDEGYAQRIQEQFQSLELNLKEELQKGLAKIELVDKKILISLASQDSFESGSATIKRSFLPTLQRVRQSIRNNPERITISGHTDNIPINTVFSNRFQSNWDLSSARASSVADFMRQDSAINDSRLRVYGFAETRPEADNSTIEGRAQNRRVEIEIGQ